jgi:hypothetical protein
MHDQRVRINTEQENYRPLGMLWATGAKWSARKRESMTVGLRVTQIKGYSAT